MCRLMFIQVVVDYIVTNKKTYDKKKTREHVMNERVSGWKRHTQRENGNEKREKG